MHPTDEKSESRLSPWTLGLQLRRWRGRARLTAAEAGQALGVTQQTVSNWETGSTRPHIRRSAEIEDLYGLQRGMVRALLSGDVPPRLAIDPDTNELGADGELVWTTRTSMSSEMLQLLAEDGPLPTRAAGEPAYATDRELANVKRRLAALDPRKRARTVRAIEALVDSVLDDDEEQV